MAELRPNDGRMILLAGAHVYGVLYGLASLGLCGILSWKRRNKRNSNICEPKTAGDR